MNRTMAIRVHRYSKEGRLRCAEKRRKDEQKKRPASVPADRHSPLLMFRSAFLIAAKS